jgi:hypothetical protein
VQPATVSHSSICFTLHFFFLSGAVDSESDDTAISLLEKKNWFEAVECIIKINWTRFGFQLFSGVEK